MNNNPVPAALYMGLISVPALGAKILWVLFKPCEALMMDTKDKFRIIGEAPMRVNRLYYISDTMAVSDKFYSTE